MTFIELCGDFLNLVGNELRISPCHHIVNLVLVLFLDLVVYRDKRNLKWAHVFCVAVMLSQYLIALLYAPACLINTYADEVLSWVEIGCPPLVAVVLIYL